MYNIVNYLISYHFYIALKGIIIYLSLIEVPRRFMTNNTEQLHNNNTAGIYRQPSPFANLPFAVSTICGKNFESCFDIRDSLPRLFAIFVTLFSSFMAYHKSITLYVSTYYPGNIIYWYLHILRFATRGSISIIYHFIYYYRFTSASVCISITAQLLNQ